MAKGKEKSTDKCGCKPGMGIVALILSVVGIYSIILGIRTQWASDLVYTNWAAMLYYAIGVITMALAKMSKYHAYCRCDMHSMG